MIDDDSVLFVLVWSRESGDAGVSSEPTFLAQE